MYINYNFITWPQQKQQNGGGVCMRVHSHSSAPGINSNCVCLSTIAFFFSFENGGGGCVRARLQ